MKQQEPEPRKLFDKLPTKTSSKSPSKKSPSHKSSMQKSSESERPSTHKSNGTKISKADTSPSQKSLPSATPTAKTVQHKTVNSPAGPKTPGAKKVDVKSKLEPQKSPTKKKTISYLDKVDELIVITENNYFDLEIEQLVIRKMQDKINFFNDSINSFGESNSNLEMKIRYLTYKKEKLKEENIKLKNRIKLIMDLAQTEDNVQFSGALKCLKTSKGIVEFDDN